MAVVVSKVVSADLVGSEAVGSVVVAYIAQLPLVITSVIASAIGGIDDSGSVNDSFGEQWHQ